LGLSAETTIHLGAGLGTLAGGVLDLVAERPCLAERLDPELPAIQAEVVNAARNELALTVTDALARRLRLDIEAADHGIGAARTAADLLGDELGWDVAERERQVRAYTQYAAERLAGLERDATTRSIAG
jgi:glycerol-3-phosphate dehydrogenase